MKRLLIGSIFTLFLYSAFSQQLDFRPRWYLGVKGGVSASKVNFSPAINQDYTIRNSYGVIARYLSEKHVGLQMELVYDQKGWTENTNNYERQLNYISFPFLTHISLGNCSTKFFINIGPQVGYLWQENAIGMPEGSTAEQYKYTENKFDYGITGALGTELHTKIGVYQLEARYYYGIGNIYGNKAADFFSLSSNQTISIHFAILFGL